MKDNSSKSSSRTPVKLMSIVKEIRGRIVRGHWSPGSQLPTREELQQEFQASRVTIQRALDRLMEEGFVRAKRRSGTYVTDSPPHLSHYGLVFPYRPTESRVWSRFWTILRDRALAMHETEERRIHVFYCDGRHGDRDDYDELEASVVEHRVAGLIFAMNPLELTGRIPLTQKDMPRVAIMRKPEFPEIRTIVSFDVGLFIEKALNYLAERNRKRIALISSAGTSLPREFQDIFQKGMADRGMVSHPYWRQAVTSSDMTWARNLVHLLMERGHNERPDALIITDENLVDHTTSGLVAAGVAVPEECDVVSHCSYPCQSASVLPYRRLGYDVREALDRCLEVIDLQRQGSRAPAEIKVPALFEDELEPEADTGTGPQKDIEEFGISHLTEG